MKLFILPQLILMSFIFLSTAQGAGSSPKKIDPAEKAAKAEAIDLYNQGTAHLMDLDFTAAEEDLRAALEKNSKLAEAHNNLAFALRKQGQDHFKDALKHYNRAIRSNRNLAEAYMYRGVLFVSMGEPKKATKDLKRLKKLSPELATELEWVIENGKEKEPAHFFGVTQTLGSS